MGSSRLNPPSWAALGLMYLKRESWTMAMPSVARSTTWRYFSSLSRRDSSARRRAVVSLRMTRVQPSPPGMAAELASTNRTLPSPSRIRYSWRGPWAPAPRALSSGWTRLNRSNPGAQISSAFRPTRASNA